MKTVDALLKDRFERYRDRPFLAMEGGASLSYQEVSKAIHALGEALVERSGIRPGQRVLLVARNGILFPLAYLTCLARGLVVMPVNPDASPREAGRILSLGKPDFALVDASLPPGSWLGLLNREPATRICPSPGEELLVLGPMEGEAPLGGAELLFTSGTTGDPKGVALTEAQLLKTAEEIVRAHALTENDICYCPLPLYHINAEVVGVLSALVSGGSVVIGRKFSATTFWETLRRHEVTWVTGVPPILAILVRRGPDGEKPARLRFFRSASAPLPAATLLAFERAFEVPVIETYGLTEAASQVAANPLPPAERKPGSVGIPWGVDLQVVNEEGLPLLAGETGEVAVRGPAVVESYVIGETSAFQDGWFLTGDLGHKDEDGYLFLTGRKSDIINRGGQKVAPREVEEVLLTHPFVLDAAVSGLQDPVLGQKVAAWVVLRPDVPEPVAQSALVRHAQTFLSTYKCPESLFFVGELPKSANGKVRRHLLTN